MGSIEPQPAAKAMNNENEVDSKPRKIELCI